jgi:hypothetical protein
MSPVEAVAVLEAAYLKSSKIPVDDDETLAAIKALLPFCQRATLVTFWKAAGDRPGHPGAVGIDRSQTLNACLNGICREAGVPRP